MIDHIGIPVSNYARAKAFYEKALAPLGYAMILEVRQSEHDAPAAGCLRPQYHPNYYGAFVLDPDGHNIEAVCHNAA